MKTKGDHYLVTDLDVDFDHDDATRKCYLGDNTLTVIMLCETTISLRKWLCVCVNQHMRASLGLQERFHEFFGETAAYVLRKKINANHLNFVKKKDSII